MDPTAPRVPALRPSLVGAVALVVALLLGTAVRADAHGEEGIMEILELTAAGSTVTLEVGVVYANDDDPAEEAAVTVTATGPDGSVVGPLPVPNVTSGRYGTTFDVPTPGAWTVAVAATGPVAAASGTVEADASPDTTVAPSTAPTTGPPTTAPPTTAASTDPDATAPAPTDTTTVADDDDDGGSGAGLVVLALLVAAVVAALAVVAVRRGRQAVD